MNYKDWELANESINSDRETVASLTLEALAALDVAQQISYHTNLIENSRKYLEQLKKAQENLPAINKDLLKISPAIVREADYRFRGKRDLQDKLYGRKNG